MLVLKLACHCSLIGILCLINIYNQCSWTLQIVCITFSSQCCLRRKKKGMVPHAIAKHTFKFLPQESDPEELNHLLVQLCSQCH